MGTGGAHLEALCRRVPRWGSLWDPRQRVPHVGSRALELFYRGNSDLDRCRRECNGREVAGDVVRLDHSVWI